MVTEFVITELPFAIPKAAPPTPPPPPVEKIVNWIPVVALGLGAGLVLAVAAKK